MGQPDCEWCGTAGNLQQQWTVDWTKLDGNFDRRMHLCGRHDVWLRRQRVRRHSEGIRAHDDAARHAELEGDRDQPDRHSSHSSVPVQGRQLLAKGFSHHCRFCDRDELGPDFGLHRFQSGVELQEAVGLAIDRLHDSGKSPSGFSSSVLGKRIWTSKYEQKLHSWSSIKLEFGVIRKIKFWEQWKKNVFIVTNKTL